jgi:hypothetical protein
MALGMKHGFYSASGGADIITDGLVGYWDPGNKNSYPGSGTTWYDLSGYGNHGAISGATFDSNGYFVFDGTNDGVDCGDDTSLDITSTITLSVWVNMDVAGQQGENYQIVGRDGLNSGTVRNYGILAYEPDGKIYYQNWTGGTNYYVGWDSGVWQANTWYNFTATYDGSYDRIYTNGELDCTPHAHTGPLDNKDINFSIGYRLGQNERYTNGKIGPTAVYNRALSADEVLYNYNIHKERFGY